MRRLSSARVGAERAHAEFETRAVRDHVVRGARVHRADRDDRRLRRIDVARDDRLQRHHDARRDDHRVDRQVRPGRVAADAFDRDDRLVAGRHERAAPRQEHARCRARMVVHAEHRVAREALEQAIVDHLLRAAVDAMLFRRLEIQVHGAGVAGLREVLRGAEQHRRVAVVAARMHLAVRAARVGQPVASMIGSARHVGANADAARAVAHAQRADHARLADPARHLPAPLFELLGDERGRVVLLVRGSGVVMDVVTDLAQPAGGGQQILDFGESGIGGHQGPAVCLRTQRGRAGKRATIASRYRFNKMRNFSPR